MGRLRGCCGNGFGDCFGGGGKLRTRIGDQGRTWTFCRRCRWGDGPECWIEGCGDLGEVPDSCGAVADDVMEGRGQRRSSRHGALLGQALEEDEGEVVDVAGLEGFCVLLWIVGCGGDFADAVAAEFDDFASGKDVGGLDVLVDEVAGVEGFERGDEAGGDLAGLVGGKGAIGEDFGEAGFGGLHDGVDEGGLVEGGLAVFSKMNEVDLVDLSDDAPAVEDFGFVEVGFDQTDDGGCAGAVRGGEKCAASLGAEELFKRVGFCDCSSFVVVPKLHIGTNPGGNLFKEESLGGKGKQGRVGLPGDVQGRAS